MEIFVNRTEASVTEKKNREQNKRNKKKTRNRRKNLEDRRRSVNEGVFVRLSTRDERRSGYSRRKNLSESQERRQPQTGSNDDSRLPSEETQLDIIV